MSANPEGLKKSSFLPLLIITALAIGLYLNTLKNGFVYDDESTIVKNTLIKSFNNLPLLFDKAAYFSRSGEMSYRPVVTFTYFIDYAFYGLKPWGYHLTNVFLHAINGVLLYIFLTLLLTPHSSRFTSPPFLISLLFVSHPVLTEGVNCISYREDLLAFLFYMTALSLYLILRQPTSDHRPPATALLYPLSCLTYLLALFSKEMAVTLSLIILCHEWLYGREKLPSRLFNRYSIGYITITLFYLYLRFYLFHNPEEQIEAWSLVERFLTLPWLITAYLKLSSIPVPLSAGYVINPASSPFSLIFILSIFTIILIMGVRERKILFGALFFLITLAPVYNLVPLANPLAERYLYLPMAGAIMFVVYIAYIIGEKVRPAYRNHCMPIFLLIILSIFAFSVVKRNLIWRDNYSLWSDTVVKMPNSSRAHNNLGIAYFYQGRFDEAIGEYLTAIKLRFNNARAHNNLGEAYFRQGRYDEAIYELKTALRLKPDYANAYYTLGNTYGRQGLFDRAIKEFLTGIRLKPDDAYAYNNLGIIYTKQGLIDQAIKEFFTAIRLEPNDAVIHYNLGIVYLKQGRYDEAINEFTIALKLKPDYKEAYQNIEALMKKRRVNKDAVITTDQDKNWIPF